MKLVSYYQITIILLVTIISLIQSMYTSDVAFSSSIFNENINPKNGNFDVMMPPDDCADIEIIDLRNVPGFPQFDDVNKCGQADTLSFIIFTGDPGEIQGFELTLDLPTGIEYAGWEFTQLGNTSISVSDTRPDKPMFLVTGITGDSLVIANIGIRANCNVDKTEELYIEFEYDYVFIDTTGAVFECSGEYTPPLEYNSSVHVPVINMLAPLNPVEVTVSSIGGNFCQIIDISQDGLNAYIDSFRFEIIGVDFTTSELILDTVYANGIGIPGVAISHDPGMLTSSFIVDGPYFINNALPNPVDDRMNTNEITTIEVCYAIESCPIEIDLPLNYNASFGCNGERCEETSQTSFVKIRPTGALLPLATSVLNSGGIEICGNPGTVDLKISIRIRIQINLSILI